MIIPKYDKSQEAKDIVEDLTLVWPKSIETRKVIERGIIDSIELYLGAIEYLTIAVLFYQPKTTEIIKLKQKETERLFVYIAEAVFDSAILLTFNLYDSDKKIKFKNILTIQKHIDLLPVSNKSRDVWGFSPKNDLVNQLERIKNLRDKNIAHHERDGIRSIELSDVSTSLIYTHDYLVAFMRVFASTVQGLPTLKDQGGKLYNAFFDIVGVNSNVDKSEIIKQYENFIQEVTSSIA